METEEGHQTYSELKMCAGAFEGEYSKLLSMSMILYMWITGSKCETTITLSTSAIQSTSSTSFASSAAQASLLTLTLSTSSSAAAVPDNQINKFEEDEVVQTTGRKHKVKGHKLNHDLHSSRESNSPAYAIPLSSLGSVAAHSAMLKKPPNPYEIYLNFKKKTEEKRVRLSTMSPKPPPKFFDYLMMKGNYKLSQNASLLVKEEALTIFSPSLVPETLRGLYEEQERARNNLQTEHIKERERLTLLSEQETLRIYSRAGRATANQGECLSACAVLCSEDFCSPHDLDNGEGFGGAGGPKDSRSRFNGRHFNAWLQEIVDKYAKLKAKLISRHHQEADILHCTQKLDWEWGMKEKGLYDTQLTPTDIKTFVPLKWVETTECLMGKFMMLLMVIATLTMRKRKTTTTLGSIWPIRMQ
ncbi:hypothetical protein HELRODRAFT_169540 [Helobdella robusta]|uniref:Uncharacterized protein n=1 Tax=Helobdella robusta TaxID=6412 RepID=T1F225_HELRO|nr:hypothetical protein HELRODRAFT_169540 [Helobdella robusta]ESO08652.1 hypothetical protein HELRODRAFT_169540 [Helobdella robusta]